MIKLYRQIENRWFGLSQKIRFLLVGGFNTFLAYLLFVLFVAILQIPYRLSLIIQYILTVNISIFSMRYYVFRSAGNPKDEYFRAWGVYLFMLGFNYAALFLLIDIAGINAVISQGIYIVVSTIVIFLLHKNYSFRN
jgi:gtrA-like protein